MKNKSGNHKSTNRFKFTSFADRVNAIDIRRSALYHLEHVNIDNPEENETYFHNALIRWKVLNLTNEYVNFTKPLENIVTLPQLLHRKDDVINSLLTNLEAANILNLQPLLELVVVLARDLQDDFYNYFPKFLDCLIKLLNTKDPEQLEWTLICLAFLFKYLRVYLKRDITIVLKSILPLLSETTKWYVRNFAAESFAFVARDAKDKKKFLETLVKTVQSNKNATVGCGHLLFEVLRGVGGQFHSCASVFLPLYFSTLQDKNIDQNVLFDIITQTQGDMLESIYPKFGESYWNLIIGSVESFFNHESGSKKTAWSLKEDNVGLEYILRLIGQSLEYNRGKFLTNPLPVLNLIHNLIGAKLCESTAKTVSQIGILTVLCTHINLPHENAVHLVKKLLSLPYPEIVTNFVEEVVSSPSFDIIVFPHFIDTIDNFDSTIVRALSKICLSKSPLCKNGSDLYTWVKYPIDFGSKNDAYHASLVEIFDKDLVRILESPDDCICVLITMPHIKSLDLDIVKKSLKDFILNLIMYLKNIQSFEIDDNVAIIRNILLLMAISIESSIHIMNSENLDAICPMSEMIDVVLSYLTDYRFLCSLRILDLILTIKESEHILKYDVLLKIHLTIEKNLISPFHEIRLLTTHIYSLFEMVLPEDSINKNESLNKSLKLKESFKMFSLCHAAESLTLSVENYREQLLKLSKTVYDSIQYKLGSDLISNKFSLQFMLGFLNVNFKLIWEPLQGLILTYANGLPPNEFWQIFHPCLMQATANVRNGGISTDFKDFNYMGKLSFLQDVFNEYFDLPEKPDFIGYRIHLWEILYQASPLCVIKNKDITLLFLDFLNMEFEKPQYICNHADSVTKMSVDNEEYADDDANADDEDVKKSAVTKYTYDTLIAHLKIYSNMQNPKSLFNEQKLYTIYLEFLMHKNPVVQKVALDCILKYKNKHWMPYKDNLYNLVDGKKFKDELRIFKIETDSETIAAEDRQELMPILLRIAYSKMVTNTGIDKKGGSQMRRSLVMRFISGCTEDELLIFTDMAFKGFVEYINLDLDTMYEKINSYDDYTSFLVPKKIFGSLNLVENMREQFIKPGQLLLLPKLMKILFCIGAFLKKVLSNESELKPGYVSILKNIRNTCITSIANFFKQFDEWAWNENEILYICNIFVWPIIEKLPIEGIHSPTALLKLFSVWSQNPRYHNLFSICSRDETNKTPLPFILKLLSNNKLHHSVNEVCMQIVERLLTLEYDEESTINLTEINCIPLNNDIVKKLDLKEKLNVGSTVLLPYVSDVVTVLKDKYVKISPKKLQKRDLIILSRITEMVHESESVDVLLKFLLPILIQRIAISSTEDTFDSSVEALTKLLAKTTEPKNHVKTIVPLFSKVVTARARKQLCEALNILATLSDTETDTSLTITAKLISDMNASDEKWLEQPDFDKRLDAFKTINIMCDDDNITIELASLIVHNCFFTIAHSNDISLRSNASATLQKIVPKLIVKYKDNEFFVYDTVLNLINDGIKTENENLKMDSIALLGELVRECPDTLPVFTELHPLSNKRDKEIDFFENLQHIQIHRKTRALLKFCNHVKTSMNVPTPKTLTRFILPLASQYVCVEKYVEKSSLVEAAIDTIGIISRLLPWHQYELVLKYYINKMHNSIEHQKQLVKVISGILDAFHFDLSKASNLDEIMKNAMLPKELRGKGVMNDSTKPVEEMVVQENDGHVVNPEILPFERVIILSPSAAKRVIFTICSDILVQLNWNSTQITEHEMLHKSLRKVGSNAREADEKLRIPMGLAIVQLLQKLPQPMLDNNILGILIKVCNFLKSPLVNIRISAREILTKIMQSVGTKYFNLLLNHLSTLLTRGTQVHVLILTVHTILEALQDKFAPKEMDKYFENILKVCLNDLFGLASEEKEVVKIGNKTPEAKPSKKSFLTLRIIAQNIGDSSIVDLLQPFKTVVEKTHSKRVVLKIETCFQYLSLGLVNNNNMSIESSLIFLCGILSDSIPKLSNKKKKIVSDVVTLEEPKPVKSDCFIIAPNPRGSKKIPRKLIALTSQQSNSHVITEFGLNMLYAILQKDNVINVDIRQYLDPMIPFIIDAFKSTQVKVATLGLKCITSIWTKRIVLPELTKNIEDAISGIFQILHKYATSGLSKKDENFHLVANAFKATTSLIRHVQYYTLDLNHIKTLLMYAEHDIHDFERQATAFSLLRAIISAKYKLVEIKTIVKKIAEISITSESPRARDEASQVMCLYLLIYCSAKEIKQNIEFYTSQLEYELDHGRISAIKILQYIVDNFPEEVLVTHTSYLFVTVGMRLVNETHKECKNQVASCIEQLLKKNTVLKRNELFDTALLILSDKKPSHIELGAQLSSRFVNMEKDKFQSRLEAILPKISEQLSGGNSSVGQFVRISSNASKKDQKNLNKDNSYIQILNLMNLISESCPMVFTDVQYQSTIEEICYHCQSLLAHNHSLVRVHAVAFLTKYFQSLNSQHIFKSIKGQIESHTNFAHTIDSLKSIVLDLSSQLIPGDVSEELASTVCKSLLIILKILNDFPIKDYSKESDEENYINVDWVIKKIKSAINGEVAKSPSIVIVRMAAFKMLDDLCVILNSTNLIRATMLLMPCLLREMSKTDTSFDNIKNKATSTCSLINEKLGDDVYNSILSKSQSKLVNKRKERKMKEAQNKVNNPEKAAKRKLVLKDRKREYKKRKMDKMKGKIPSNKNYMKNSVEKMDFD